MTLLDKRFVKCSRSTLVNIEQVDSYNIKENVIEKLENLNLIENIQLQLILQQL